MSTSTPEAADPVAKGIVATAKQSFKDLFIWKQRTVVVSPTGEAHTEWHDPDPIENPIRLMAQLSARDWLFFLCGFSAWTADAFDFHALSIQTTKLAKYYGRSKTDVSEAITLTLLLRSVGAVFFGLAGDKYGRKWPMVCNMVILGLLQIATIYSATFQQFLAVRALFGIFMGGVYGNAIAMALEHCPSNARGLMSGILQQGYAFGYVLAGCANLGIGGATETWKTIFWIGAGFSFTVGLARVLFPESQQFLEAKARGNKAASPAVFWRETKKMLAAEWRMSIYFILLLAWMNAFSHSSQDSYTTFMLVQKQLSNAGASRASIMMKAGACVGGTIIGYLSQFVGRRRAIIAAAIISLCLIPAWILPQGEAALSATGFFMQFFVQGSWGVMPIHLNELSPPAFRSSFPGITYQLGNMLAAPAAQIVNAAAERNFVTAPSGATVEAYGPVMAVAVAIIAPCIIVILMFGPERRGRSFEHAVVGVEDELVDAKPICEHNEEGECGKKAGTTIQEVPNQGRTQ